MQEQAGQDGGNQEGCINVSLVSEDGHINGHIMQK